MSDPEVPPTEKSTDVDDVVGSANAGLDAAAAAAADVPGSARESDSPAPVEESETVPVDPDLAAFEQAERDHPGLFSSPTPETVSASDRRADAETDAVFAAPAPRHDVADSEPLADGAVASTHHDSRLADAAYAPDTAYAPPVAEAETRILPSEPLVAAATVSPQPIFVQAPEAPRDRGNRGTAGAIGLVATVVFAVLYLLANLGLGALAGDVDGSNIVEAVVAPLTTWGFWTPVVVFFLGFWLLGALVNRGRWGLWVVFGIVVGLFGYVGHILGQLLEQPFWKLTASEGIDVVSSQSLAPLAIASFVFARESAIWFGAWVARSGARKTELNAEAQREYERTLEAGPTLAR